MQKEHSPRPPSKEVGQNPRKFTSQEDTLGFPLNVSEPLMKDLASKLPLLEPENLELVCEETQHDVELSLIGTKPATNSLGPGLLQLEWDEPTQLKGLEMEAKSFNIPPRDDSDSKSGSTEPVDPDTCETGDEGICQQNETSSILHTIFNS